MRDNLWMLRCGVLMLALVPSAALADEHPSVALSDAWTLTVDGQIRPRLNVDSGKDFKAGDLLQRNDVTQRSRLGATIRREDGLGATIRLQDVRVWGEEGSTNDFTAKGLDVHEAFMMVPLATGAELRLGRQEIAFDNHRLVGNADFFQRARSFDAARVTWKHAEWTVTAFFSWILAGSANAEADGHATGLPTGSTATGDTGFAGVHARWIPAAGHSVSALYFWRGSKPTHEQRHTAGLFADGTVGAIGLSYTAEAYYQFGSVPAGNISAWLASGKLKYAAAVPWKPSVALFADAVSGDGKATGAFDTLYATNHRYYGEMDFFLDLPKQTGFLGLLDVGATLAVAPVVNTGLAIDAHVFRAMQEDAKSKSNVFGDEFDVRWTQKWLPGISTSVLWGIFLPGDAMGGIRGITSAALEPEQLGYLTVDANF